MRGVRNAALSLLLACLACATAPREDDRPSQAELAKLTEDSAARATHARNAWEAARETENLVLGRYRASLATASEASRATEARLRAERDLAVCDLAVDEIGIAGRSANRDIYAPVVDSDDFVLRWLEIEEIYAERIRDNLTEQHSRANTAYKTGLTSFDKVLPLDGAAAIARVKHERWRKLADLRRGIAAGSIGAAQAYKRADEIVYLSDVEMARIRVRTANRLLKYLSGLHAAGTIKESKVLAQKSELLRLQNAQHEAEMGRGPGLPRR